MNIDRTNYNKTIRIPYNPERPCGYQPRPLGRLDIRSVLVHTTNGQSGSSLRSEANYIANSRAISSHYLIGKYGEIIMFLDPKFYIAYHAGCVKATVFSNPFAVGIEMHNTPNEGHCTPLQLRSLDDLVRELIKQFDIQEKYIETHRAVAVYCKGHPRAGQLGRKIDPSGFPDNEFYSWRSTLYAPITSAVRYRVIGKEVNIRTSPSVRENNIAGSLEYGDEFESEALKVDEDGKFIHGVNTWAHLTKGNHKGKPVDGLGFVHLSNLITVG